MQGAAAKPGSLQDKVKQTTCLNRRDVADILNIIEHTFANPAMQQAVADYGQSVATGGTISNKMTSPLIRQINSIVDSDARPQARMVRPRVRGDEAVTQVSEKQDEVRRQSGKDDNLKQLKCLRQEVNDRFGISLTDKAKLNQALAELGTNVDAEKAAASHALKFDNQDLL